MSNLARLGSTTISLTAGQSLIVGSFGPGQTKIYTAATIVGQIPPIFTLFAVVTGGSLYTTFANATTVMIEASPGSDIEYDFGTQPALTNNPFSTTTGLVAKAGGGQSGATPLTGNINRLITTATAGDSALLPPAVPGRRVSVFNAGVASANIFPQTGESIGTGAANAAFAIATAKGALFDCVAAGVWNVNLSA